MPELKWVLLPEHFLACRQLLSGNFTQKKRFRIVKRSLYAGKTDRQCTKTWSLVAQGRWSLFMVVATARFYCMIIFLRFQKAVMSRNRLMTPTYSVGKSSFIIEIHPDKRSFPQLKFGVVRRFLEILLYETNKNGHIWSKQRNTQCSCE